MQDFFNNLDWIMLIKAFVVGSDQVWSSMHGKSFCGSVINAFLPFTEGIKLKRIAYAASFGKDNWEYSEKETEQAKKMLILEKNLLFPFIQRKK